ncbi:MAG: carbamate kinase [Thermodesulfobacteriota bacterium]
MRVVVALGGNALLRRGERPEAEVQRANVRRAAASVAALAREHAVVVTHGNGPQVGLLALQSLGCPAVAPYPLDVLGAESEGMIGYLIEQQLAGFLPGRDVATLLTQVEVDAGDPAFAAPTKPIGPVYDEADARRLARERGFPVAPDGAGFRRVVPSPEPRRIRELRAIEVLLAAGVLVVCAGGGGIPVVTTPEGGIRGVEAVVDKDLASALLARELAADALLLLTDVPAVLTEWPGPGGTPIRHATPAELRARRFAPGTMAPKVEAACRFVEGGGALAAIGALDDAARLLHGDAGTIVRAAAG